MFITEVKMVKVWRLLSVSIVVAVCLGLLLVPVAIPGPGQVALASNNVTVSIENSTTYVLPNGSFTIDAVINNPDGMNVSMFNIQMDFDPTYFNVTSVVGVDFPEHMAAPVWDNVAGTIKYDPKTVIGTSINGTYIVGARINCTAKALEGTSTVSYVYKSFPPPPRYTKVIMGTTDYLEYGNMSLMINGTVIVGTPGVTYNLTVTSDGCCPIDVTGAVSGTVPAGGNQTFTGITEGANVTVSADDSAVCCGFVNWSDAGLQTHAITMDSDKSVTAYCSVPSYNLMVDVNPGGGGNVTVNGTTPSGYPNTTTWVCGDNVTLNAVAASGYSFNSWSGNLSGSANPTNITMDSNKNVTAHFAPNRTLTMAVNGNGTTVPAVGSHIYGNGTVVNISASPDPSWEFVNWTTTGNISEIANSTAQSTTVEVDENKTVTANFAEVTAATLEGNVTFPGRGAAPNNKWIENFTVKGFEAGNLSHMLWTGNATTDNTGVFIIAGLTPDTYDIRIKGLTSVSELEGNVTLTAGNTTVVDFGTMREGDCNDDNWITGADRNLLYTGWGSTVGDGNWNPDCDLNADDWLTGADRNLMYTYWGQSGD